MPEASEIESINKAVQSCKVLIEDLKATLESANPFVADIVFKQLDVANEMLHCLKKTSSHLSQMRQAEKGITTS